ncbi:MAG: peptidoglycan editing factor PgeF [Chloroflexi bacterium]|nr:peptidoglycan editing factor PgeF [Chloroflexota bacterium]
MQRNTNGTLAYYTFDSLPDSVIHSISTRHGGVSLAPFHTLNLSRAVGDDPENVATNIERWHAAFSLDASSTVKASQAQADRVVAVGEEHRGTVVVDVDALLTNARRVPLMLRFADCVPILFFDPVRQAIGIAHAGWRGAVLKIVTQAARTMFDAFGTRPRDLIACIGPSIGPCCYRVGDDVSARVRAAYAESDQLLIRRDGATYFDLWQANASQLRALGVEQIEIAGICTAEHTDDFYSARAENHRTGRFGVLIALK